ncbi:hypothetical protein [Candidatus Pantoea persica]|uniref:hypothetical protein n=1 Tax=Candidatus Pantoea persica TaxID=2518128 RepID=UPI00215D95EF|nr:hypothetical protein [Candidatus Pantoea persica]MBA2815135.1 hypothetical protein [Candidatus Pantoea persica]
MRLYSNDFNDGDKMPERHVFNSMGYQGNNISPHLAWDEAPQGESHRYIFTVHALDVEAIEVDAEASGAMVGFNVHFHALASASITVNYA